MSLSDLASLGSFVSGFAVLVSLIYLSLQVRQAERNQRAIIQMERATRFSDHLDRMADPNLVNALDKGMSGESTITPLELTQFALLFRSTVYNFEDAYLQHAQKLVDDRSFASTMGTLKGVFGYPGYRVMWKRQRLLHDPGFRSLIDGVLAEVKVTRPASSDTDVEAWQEEIAAELEGA
jgi:hypothetical protein